MSRDSRAYKILCSMYHGVLKRERLLRWRRKLEEARQRKQPVSLEGLEARVLLDGATPWVVDLDDLGVAAVTVGLNPNNDHIELSNGDAVLSSRPLADTDSLDLRGSGLDDTVKIDDSISGQLTVLFDGRDGSDTLIGPDLDSQWRITGLDSGVVGDVQFKNIENLTGGVDNEDTFTFDAESGGELSGVVEGGAGGFDIVEIDGGNFNTVIYTAIGPDSGSIDLDGNVIDYSGMEPLANSGTAADVIINATSGVDEIRIQNDLFTPGNIQIISENGSFETTSIPTPSNSLTINGGDGNDIITVNTLSLFDTSSRTLIINGGADNDILDATDFGEDVTLQGGTGDDILIGGEGDDTYIGGAGIDTVDESAIREFGGSSVTITDSALTFTTSSGPDTNSLASIERAILSGNNVDMLNTSGFTGQVLYTAGAVEWVAQGPGAVTDGFSRLGDDDPEDRLVTGAIQDVVVHPSNPNIIYVATVNGGVWKTDDGGTSWDALTDQFPTLSLATVTLDLDDPDTVYAGTGRTSAYRNEGGEAIGILKSIDAGLTWTVIGQSAFRGERVTGIVAKGTTIIASTDDKNRSLYISTDGGVNFNHVAAPMDGIDNDGDTTTDEAGEPFGPISDMIAEQVGGNLTVYVAAEGIGIYRSDDGGGSWANINRNLPNGILTNSVHIRLAVSNAGNQPVYAGFVNSTDGNEQVTGLFRLANPGDGAVNWVEMDRPGEDDAATDPDEGIHPGGQADGHFSIVADPDDADIVFVGGDTSPDTTAGIFTGNLFRGDASAASGSQWAPITNSDANDTAPHPDSRNMIFDSDGNILEVDDGGIYKLTNPNDDSTREWVSMIGDLSLMEFTSVVYDPINDVIIGGAQDNGTVLQSTSNPNQWTTVRGGDGQVVQVAVDGTDSTLYFSAQRLANFSRIENADPSSRVRMDLEVDGTGFFDDISLPEFETVDVDGDGNDDLLRFGVQYAVNAVDPSKLMFATRFIYETQERSFDFENIVPGLDAGIDLDIWGGSAGDVPPVGTDFQIDTGALGTATTLAYGGHAFNGSTREGNAEIAYVGTQNTQDILLRQEANGAFQKTDWNSGSHASTTPRDLILHPDDWKQVFVVTTNEVWHGVLNDMMDTPVIEYAWTELTGNIAELGPKFFGIELTSITLYQASTGDDATDADDDTFVLITSGLGGVFKTTVEIATLVGTPSDQHWTEYGNGLPVLKVTDVRYDPTDDVLLAGTLGRGAWTIPNASETLTVDSVLRVVGHDANGDTISLVRDATQPWLVNVFFDGAVAPAVSLELASIGKIELVGRGGYDTFQIYRTYGTIFANGGITIAGDTGANDLQLINSGSLTGNANMIGSDWIVEGRDPFGITKTVEIDLTDVTSPAGEVVMGSAPLAGAPSTPEGAAIESGLTNLFASSGQALIDSIAGESFAVFEAGSLISGLSGSLVQFEDPLGKSTSAIQRAAPDGLALVDIGSSILKRFFESGQGEFDLTETIESGPTVLRDALQALDPGGSVVMTGSDFGAINYDVQLTKQLEGMIDLQVIGDALVSQLGITEIADALADIINFNGSVAITADVTLDIEFGADTDGFFVGVDAANPEVVISNIQINGDGTLNGDFGFLAAKLSNLMLTLETGLELRFDLIDPGSVAADDIIRPTEMSNVTAAFTLQSPGTAGTPDVMFSADLDVLVTLPGLNFTAFETDITFEWAGLQDTSFELSSAGTDADAVLSFLKLNPQDLFDKFNELKDQLLSVSALVDFDIPFLDVSFSDLANVVELFDQRVLSQLQLSPTASFSTAQGLAAALSASMTFLQSIDEFDEQDLADLAESRNVLRAIEDLGFSYDSASGELTYNLNAEFSFDLDEALDFGFDLEEGLGGISASADANLEIKAMMNLTLGIDLGGLLAFDPDSLLDNFFLRDASLAGSVKFDVADFDAAARFGFVDVQVVDGTAIAEATLTVSLNDPGSNMADGRIDLSELIDGISDIGSLIDVELTGTAGFALPLAAPFLGITASEATTVGVLFPDLSDPSDIVVTLPDLSGIFGEIFNFNNISAGTIVGLLAQVTSWLDDFRRSDTFAAFDIPFVGPALDDILGFADEFRDTLLFDDMDDDDPMNDVPKLVDENDAPTFETVGEFATKLAEILGIPVEYDATDDTLTYTVDLSGTFGELDLPADFNLDLGPLLNLESDSMISLSASGGLTLTIGIFLGDAPSSTMLDGTKLLSEIGDGVDIETDLAISTIMDVATVYGQMSGDATFGLSVDGGGAVEVVVAKDDTNTTVTALVEDINTALTTASLNAQVQAQVNGNRVNLVALGGVTSIELTTTSGDPTINDLGFSNGQMAVDDEGTLTLKGGKDVPGLVGRLSGNAVFNVSMNTVNGGGIVGVVVEQSNTTSNRNILDILIDVRGAINAVPALNGKLQVSSLGKRLIFTAIQPGTTSFSMTAVGGTPAVTELGLDTNNVGTSDDLLITTQDGVVSGINLDGLTTLGEVISAIGTQTSGKVTATINDNGIGLTLTDNTAGGTMFKVEAANGSMAALQLGIQLVDAQTGEMADGVIDGGTIGGISAFDRFFIQDASAMVNVSISTPEPDTDMDGMPNDTDGDGELDDGLRATATFGFVSIELSGGGTLDLGLDIGLKDPGTVAADGRITLTELFEGLSDIGTLIDGPTLTGGGSIILDISMTPDIPGINVPDDAQIGITVNNWGDPFGDPFVAPDIDFVFPDLGDLIAFDNVEFNFDSILDGLLLVADFLGQFEAFDFLDEPIPLINLSINDLLSFVDQFRDAVNEARDNPAGTIQVLEDKLKQAFGLPSTSDVIGLSLDMTGGAEILRIDLGWDTSFSESLALNLDLGLPDFADLAGAANLSATGSIDVDLSLGIDLNNPLDIFIYDSTGIVGNLVLSGEELEFRAALGPLGIFIKDGDANLTANFDAGLDAGVFTDGRILISDINFGSDFEANLMRRIGGLIYVAERERGEARKRVLARLGLDQD